MCIRDSHIQRIPDEVGGLDHREPLELRQSAGQIIQPVVAGGQHQPPGAGGIFYKMCIRDRFQQSMELADLIVDMNRVFTEGTPAASELKFLTHVD